MEEQIAKAVTLMMLGILSRQDIYEKQISVMLLFLFGSAAAFCRVIIWQSDLVVFGKGIVPGLFLLLLSFSTKEKIGYGDGLTVLVTGLWCGSPIAFTACQLAFFFSGIYGWLLFFCKKRRRIAFLPFLLAGMEVCFLLE